MPTRQDQDQDSPTHVCVCVCVWLCGGPMLYGLTFDIFISFVATAFNYFARCEQCPTFLYAHFRHILWNAIKICIWVIGQGIELPKKTKKKQDICHTYMHGHLIILENIAAEGNADSN